MPAAIAIPAIVGAASAGASIYGSRQAANANRRATQVQDTSNREAIAFAREQEQRRQQEYDREQAEARAAWDAQEARRAPYRETSQRALMSLAQLAGLPAPTMRTADAMPSGWSRDAAAPGRRPLMPLDGVTPRRRAMLPQGQPLRSMPLDVFANGGA
jgi:hypothetical protein